MIDLVPMIDKGMKANSEVALHRMQERKSDEMARYLEGMERLKEEFSLDHIRPFSPEGTWDWAKSQMKDSKKVTNEKFGAGLYYFKQNETNIGMSRFPETTDEGNWNIGNGPAQWHGWLIYEEAYK